MLFSISHAIDNDASSKTASLSRGAETSPIDASSYEYEKTDFIDASDNSDAARLHASKRKDLSQESDFSKPRKDRAEDQTEQSGKTGNSQENAGKRRSEKTDRTGGRSGSKFNGPKGTGDSGRRGNSAGSDRPQDSRRPKGKDTSRDSEGNGRSERRGGSKGAALSRDSRREQGSEASHVGRSEEIESSEGNSRALRTGKNGAVNSEGSRRKQGSTSDGAKRKRRSEKGLAQEREGSQTYDSDWEVSSEGSGNNRDARQGQEMTNSGGSEELISYNNQPEMEGASGLRNQGDFVGSSPPQDEADPREVEGSEDFPALATTSFGPSACQQAGCRNFDGPANYVVIGNSMSVDEDREDCSIEPSSSAALQIPSHARVRSALLYWSASGNVPRSPSVVFNGLRVSANKTYSSGFASLIFYGAMSDVTNHVKESGGMTVSHVEAENSTILCVSNAVYAAWSLVVVYEKADLPIARINVCFDWFTLTFPEGKYESTVQCLAGSSTTTEAKTTVVAFESDLYKGEEFFLNDILQGDNLFRGSTAPNLDINTYDILSIVKGGATKIKYSLRTYLINSSFGPAIEGLFMPLRITYNN